MSRLLVLLALAVALGSVLGDEASAQQARCRDYPNQAAAQTAYRANPAGLRHLDRAHDGVACARRPCPCDKVPVVVPGTSLTPAVSTGFAATALATPIVSTGFAATALATPITPPFAPPVAAPARGIVPAPPTPGAPLVSPAAIYGPASTNPAPVAPAAINGPSSTSPAPGIPNVGGGSPATVPGPANVARAPVPDDNTWATVARVIDRDTVLVQFDSGATAFVRLIGIDTPETVDPGGPVQCFGAQASARARELLEGQRVYLERDVSQGDRVGRLLRYVWLDASTQANLLLVLDGYVRATTVPPDVRYADYYRAAEQQAREAGRGLWSACVG